MVKGKDRCEAQLIRRVVRWLGSPATGTAWWSRVTRAAESRDDRWKTEVRWGMELLPSALAGERKVACMARGSPSWLRGRVGGPRKWEAKQATVAGQHRRARLGRAVVKQR
jgi:hypothetical protein